MFLPKYHLSLLQSQFPPSPSILWVGSVFFSQWENRTELVWYLNRLSFLLKPPALAIWLYFFFPSRKEDGQKKTYTHCWFQPQELCLQCSVALNYYRLIVNIDICLLTLIFLGDRMVVEWEWERLGKVRPGVSFLCVACCKELTLFM